MESEIIKSFITKVKQMREQQKRYFKSAPNTFDKSDSLASAKALERNVDEWIAEYEYPNKQGNLF
jgi:hypothetical protein